MTKRSGLLNKIILPFGIVMLYAKSVVEGDFLSFFAWYIMIVDPSIFSH